MVLLARGLAPDWIERLVPTTGTCNKPLSLVDNCHVMGTAHLYKNSDHLPIAPRVSIDVIPVTGMATFFACQI